MEMVQPKREAGSERLGIQNGGAWEALKPRKGFELRKGR